MSGSEQEVQKSELFDKLEAVYRANVPNFEHLLSCERLSGGASQETYRIKLIISGQEVVQAMRRSPGGTVLEEKIVGHPGLEAEALLMQAAKEAGVPEPQVHYVLKPEDGIGDGFIMEWIEGEALGARINRSDEFANLRPSLAFACGEIMAQIHNIDLDASGLREKLDEVSPEQFVQQTWERYKVLSTPQPMIDYAALWLLDNLPQNYKPSLVHNDFRNGNFMVSPERIVAVLDWELAHIGDPMRDLGWICVNSWRFGGDQPVGGFGSYEQLFAGYEAVTGEQIDPDAVKFWEVFGSFWWAVGCLGMAEHYRTGPDKTVERPAIGRRSSECQVDCVNLLFPGPLNLIEGDDLSASGDMPRADELLVSVRDFLRQDVMSETKGRTNFMARVASNSLDIVLREASLGEATRTVERDSLVNLLGEESDLTSLRWSLVERLRSGEMSLDSKSLQFHLRNAVANQIAIDQPKYSGFKQVLGNDT
jgi:aminoglycoside phosphotransferase (APT) family kinase protein